MKAFMTGCTEFVETYLAKQFISQRQSILYNCCQLNCFNFSNHGYETPKQAAGYYTLRFARLFDLQISIHFVFEI